MVLILVLIYSLHTNTLLSSVISKGVKSGNYSALLERNTLHFEVQFGSVSFSNESTNEVVCKVYHISIHQTLLLFYIEAS